MTNINYIIIGGTNKGGTTSLFEYLGAHPEICPSFIKQTFFFLDKGWQAKYNLVSLYDYEKGFDEYNNFFRECKKKRYYLEASPEYLYAPNVPERLYRFSEDHSLKVCFILREPLSRMISLFYYGKEQGILDEKLNFENFYSLSKYDKNDINISLMAYKTSFYSFYLKRYFDYFDRKHVSIYFFEDLLNDPKGLMKNIAKDLRIRQVFFEKINFGHYNKTSKVKNKVIASFYNHLRQIIINCTYRNNQAYYFTEFFKNLIISPLYRKINLTPIIKETIDSQLIKDIRMEFRDEKNELQTLVGREIPWTY